MISLKRLIMKPGSPDRAIEQAWSESEAGLARIAHVNRLSRDIMDIKFYELDIDATGTLNISSKKGIVEIVNASDTVTSLNVWLRHPEITANHDNFYLQLTVYCNNTGITPIIIGRGFSGDMFELEIKNLLPADTWGLLYFYYEIVKID